ncbi:MAG: hypothetical protein ACKJSG_02690 [Lentisphaeria bacterium]
MRRYLAIFILVSGLGMVPAISAAEVSQAYRGDLLHKEHVATESNPFITAEFLGLREGNLAFLFRRMDLQVIRERPIYQKVMVTRNDDDMQSSGIRIVVPGETLEGPIESRQQRAELGLLPDASVQFEGISARTNRNGVFIDNDQTVLAIFDDLKVNRHAFTITNLRHGNCEVELTRLEMYKKLDIDYDETRSSHADQLVGEVEWNRSSYRAGDVAVLSLKVTNGSKDGEIYRLLGRTVSRWPWLDGKMFYIGDLGPGESRVASRRLVVPEDLPEDLAVLYLRIGFNDLTGGKPQVPATVHLSAK